MEPSTTLLVNVAWLCFGLGITGLVVEIIRRGRRAARLRGRISAGGDPVFVPVPRPPRAEGTGLITASVMVLVQSVLVLGSTLFFGMNEWLYLFFVLFTLGLGLFAPWAIMAVGLIGGFGMALTLAVLAAVSLGKHKVSRCLVLGAGSLLITLLVSLLLAWIGTPVTEGVIAA